MFAGKIQMPFMGVKRTLGCDSSIASSFSHHLAPSTYSP
jgi:hypothetical protein